MSGYRGQITSLNELQKLVDRSQTEIIPLWVLDKGRGKVLPRWFDKVVMDGGDITYHSRHPSDAEPDITVSYVNILGTRSICLFDNYWDVYACSLQIQSAKRKTVNQTGEP